MIKRIAIVLGFMALATLFGTSVASAQIILPHLGVSIPILPIDLGSTFAPEINAPLFIL